MEYSCGMEIGLWLELGSGVKVGVMARAWVGVRVRILFCSSIATISRNFTHAALRSRRMGMVLRLALGSVVRFRVSLRV